MQVVTLKSIRLKMMVVQQLATLPQGRTSDALSALDMEMNNVPIESSMLLSNATAAIDESAFWSDDCADSDMLDVQTDCALSLDDEAAIVDLNSQPDRPRCTTLHSSAYMTPPSSQKKSERSQSSMSTGSQKEHCSKLVVKGLMTILETGLRHAVRGTPARRSSSTRVVNNEDFKCLSALAPALWVPECHRAVSNRAVFLPTLSHAISNVSRNCSTSAGLHNKVQELVRRRQHGNFALQSSEIDHTQTALSVGLWHLVVSNSQKHSAKQLRPFSVHAEIGDALTPSEMIDDLLDDAESEPDFCQDSDGSDFEDLLGTNSKVRYTRQQAETEPNAIDFCDRSREALQLPVLDQQGGFEFADLWDSDDCLICEDAPHAAAEFPDDLPEASLFDSSY